MEKKIFIFDIEYVVNDLTQGMTLRSSTIIVIGTLAGVVMVMRMNTPKF